MLFLLQGSAKPNGSMPSGEGGEGNNSELIVSLTPICAIGICSGNYILGKVN